VNAEATYLLARRLGSRAEVRFIGDFAAENFIA